MEKLNIQQDQFIQTVIYNKKKMDNLIKQLLENIQKDIYYRQSYKDLLNILNSYQQKENKVFQNQMEIFRQEQQQYNKFKENLVYKDKSLEELYAIDQELEKFQYTLDMNLKVAIWQQKMKLIKNQQKREEMGINYKQIQNLLIQGYQLVSDKEIKE